MSFRVIVNGMESPIMMYNAGEEEVSTYVEFDPRYSTVLDVNFASITGGARKPRTLPAATLKSTRLVFITSN